MGRLELLVLGLTCCLAAVSAAKVSENPAEAAGAHVVLPNQVWGQAQRRASHQGAGREPIAAALPGTCSVPSPPRGRPRAGKMQDAQLRVESFWAQVHSTQHLGYARAKNNNTNSVDYLKFRCN